MKFLVQSLVMGLVTLWTTVAAQNCVDPDRLLYNDSYGKTSKTTKDVLTDMKLYCDQTISWPVLNSSVFDMSKHQAGMVCVIT